MADPKHTPDQRSSENTGRETYASPTLKEFGPVGVLTQSGTGQQMENQTMTGTDRSPMG